MAQGFASGAWLVRFELPWGRYVVSACLGFTKWTPPSWQFSLVSLNCVQVITPWIKAALLPTCSGYKDGRACWWVVGWGGYRRSRWQVDLWEGGDHFPFLWGMAFVASTTGSVWTKLGLAAPVPNPRSQCVGQSPVAKLLLLPNRNWAEIAENSEHPRLKVEPRLREVHSIICFPLFKLSWVIA